MQLTRQKWMWTMQQRTSQGTEPPALYTPSKYTLNYGELIKIASNILNARAPSERVPCLLNQTKMKSATDQNAPLHSLKWK